MIRFCCVKQIGNYFILHLQHCGMPEVMSRKLLIHIDTNISLPFSMLIILLPSEYLKMVQDWATPSREE